MIDGTHTTQTIKRDQLNILVFKFDSSASVGAAKRRKRAVYTNTKYVLKIISKNPPKNRAWFNNSNAFFPYPHFLIGHWITKLITTAPKKQIKRITRDPKFKYGL